MSIVNRNKTVYNETINIKQIRQVILRKIMALDDAEARMMIAAIKVVRQNGLEGVRIQNISELPGISLISSPVP